MNKYEFKTLERIDRRTAERLYNNGFSVLFIPCKLNPENNFYNLGIWENNQLEGQYKDFETLYNAFVYYNCNFETGRYIAFYIPKEKSFIHFEFANGSNPYIFRGTALEQLKELEKWRKCWNIETLKEGFYRLEEKNNVILQG